MTKYYSSAWILALFTLANAIAQETPAPSPPVIAEESNEAELAIAGFKKPAGWTAELFAAEPMVANPVAFTVDHQGRVFVCETFRQGKGIEDNRNHPEWLEDDLAAQTVADRLAYIKKHLGEKAIDYTLHDDRIRRLVDADGDGRADEASVFADRFNNIVAGTGSSVLSYRGRVYYTCIPHVWMFADDDDDGEADSRQSLHEGYGVRFAFRGHDLHGLTIGPDGRLYFSVGDRGYNVVTADGRRLADPESGAVFACELDGSKLEVIATGLRNPQELAFDDFGNLFTGDNNSDSGDKARWVYVVPGGDSGWRMSYQYLDDRGPFNREKLWHPFHAGQPAYIVPPVTNLADGPSGLAYYPGTGLADHFRGRFFLCDFRGAAATSGIRTFRVQPEGAFFKLIDQEQTLWNILATDVEFGPNGLYVSDWVHGWNGEGKGRIYRFVDSEAMSRPEAAEVKDLLAAGFADREEDELAALLRHPDKRIRQEAQFALVDLGAAETLARAAADEEHRISRLHGLWGVGQLGRRGEHLLEGLETGLSLLDDGDAEVRAHAAQLLGQIQATTAVDNLIERLQDESLRVRYFSAMAIGQIGRAPAKPDMSQAVSALLAMLAENDNRDPIVRHGAIMGLVGAADDEALSKAAEHDSPAARLGVVVAMRKRSMPQVAVLLNDTEGLVAEEAARAIYDVPIAAAMPHLAGALAFEDGDNPLQRRALNAHYRLGQKENAEAIVDFICRGSAESLRLEALDMLPVWGQPPPRDRLLGMVRPLPKRDPAIAREALRAALPRVFATRMGDEAALTAANMGLKEAAPMLLTMIRGKHGGNVRAAALTALARLEDASTEKAMKAGLRDREPEVRSAARQVLADTNPKEAAPELEAALDARDCTERQAALATLAGLKDASANEVLIRACDKLLAGEIPPDTRLDVIEAARRRQTPALAELIERYEKSRDADDPLAANADALAGGDAERGRELFFARGQLSCVRCHIIADNGGEVGPDLTKIGAEKTREYLLESLVLPNKTIAKGFESVQLQIDDGRVIAGILKLEDDKTLQLMTPEGQTISIPKETIEDRAVGKSAMPEDLIKNLTPLELRDLIEYLATRRG